MSRTDQHVPFAIKVARGDLHALASDDHLSGPCDLPRRKVYVREWRPSTRCTWEFHFSGT